MVRKYNIVKDGHWFRVPFTKAKYIACCDCGLTHLMRFKLSPISGHLYVCAERDEHETASVRSRFKKKLTHLKGRANGTNI